MVRYTYDSWGKAKIAGSMAETLGKRNPFRYRGYYYDTETGMYYLKSRYYAPELRRFINADTVISGPQDGANLFAYCENNPVNMADYNGHFAIGIGIGFVAIGTFILGKIVTSEPVQRSSRNLANRFVDMVVEGARGLAGEAYNIFSYVSNKIEGKERENSAAIANSSRKQAYFPKNPFDFYPNGLVRTVEVPIGVGKNGGIINWKLPGTKIAIFEWDEDFRYGSHYHVMLKEFKNKHLNTMHYLAGMPIPEPWNSLYFS